jgi:hypothetical protein
LVLFLLFIHLEGLEGLEGLLNYAHACLRLRHVHVRAFSRPDPSNPSNAADFRRFSLPQTLPRPFQWKD